MSIDYTPSMGEYKPTGSFKFWCQKVLPLVYDDSLSYYETLCKVTSYLNDVIQNSDTLDENVRGLYDAYVHLQDYVNNYFNNLNVQNEINEKLDNMASDGSLSALIQPLFDTYKITIDNTVNTQNEEINVLKARMDTFTSLPDGSTAGNAELQDIRVGADGTVYPTAGDAVREQVSGLNSILSKLAYPNIEWEENTFLKADGSLSSAPNFITSNFIVIPEEHNLYYDVQLEASNILVFDANKNIVQVISGGDTENQQGYIKYSDKNKYVRFSTYMLYNYKITFSAKDIQNDINPVESPINSVRTFNKCLCIGDSLTEGVFNHKEYEGKYTTTISKYSYPAQFEKITNIKTTNKGHSGYTSVQWWNEEQNTDFSGYDMAIIMLGANDAAQNVSENDTYNALYNIFGKLITQNKKMKVFISSIIEPFASGVSGADATNRAIKRLVDTLTAQIYYVDTGKYSACKNGTVYVDGHLTALGYQKLAEEFASYISFIINNNLQDFKDIQFIGTEKTNWKL